MKPFNQQKSWLSQFRKGLVRLCTLAVLKTYRESYGYEILRKLREGNILDRDSTQSIVYPILSRLKKDGLVTVGEKKVSDKGPSRVCFSLTKDGEDHLGNLIKDWFELRDAVNKLLELNH